VVSWSSPSKHFRERINKTVHAHVTAIVSSHHRPYIYIYKHTHHTSLLWHWQTEGKRFEGEAVLPWQQMLTHPFPSNVMQNDVNGSMLFFPLLLTVWCQLCMCQCVCSAWVLGLWAVSASTSLCSDFKFQLPINAGGREGGSDADILGNKWGRMQARLIQDF
jgi:hypothetical protein